jgi:hypothetical protein
MPGKIRVMGSWSPTGSIFQLEGSFLQYMVQDYTFLSGQDICVVQGILGIFGTGQTGIYLYRTEWEYLVKDKLGYMYLYRTGWDYLVQDKQGYICTEG